MTRCDSVFRAAGHVSQSPLPRIITQLALSTTDVKGRRDVCFACERQDADKASVGFLLIFFLIFFIVCFVFKCCLSCMVFQV
jgi:hypothetical protein